jgi:hypothetical protein
LIFDASLLKSPQSGRDADSSRLARDANIYVAHIGMHDIDTLCASAQRMRRIDPHLLDAGGSFVGRLLGMALVRRHCAIAVRWESAKRVRLAGSIASTAIAGKIYPASLIGKAAPAVDSNCRTKKRCG